MGDLSVQALYLDDFDLGVVRVASDGHVEWANASFAKLLKYDSTEECSTDFNFRRAVHPDDSLRIEATIDCEVGPSREAFQLRTKFGGYVWVSASIVRVDDVTTVVCRDVTEERGSVLRCESALDKMEDLLEMSADWFWEQDDLGRFTYVSKGFATTVGYDIGAIIGHTKNVFEVVDHDAVEFDSLTKSRLSFSNVKFTFINGGDGPRRVVEMSGRPLFDVDGTFLGYHGTGRDVSEKIHAETSLKRMNARLEFANAVTGDAMFDWSIDPNRAEGEDDAERLQFTDFVRSLSDEDSARLRTALNLHLINQVDSVDVEVRTRDDRWLRVRAKAMQSATGKFENLIGVVSDVSANKVHEMEHALAMTAFENSSAGIVVTDRNANIVFVNPSFTKVTGYSSEEVMGTNPRVIKSGRHGKSFYDRMWFSLLTTGKWEGDIWNKKKNGEAYPERLTISAVKGADGVITNFVGEFYDVSERKLREEQITFMANFDSLTGAANKSYLSRWFVEHVINEAEQAGYVAVVYLDLDDFKMINDAGGHVTGDMVLKHCANVLKHITRADDLVVRLGGDEFCVVLKHVESRSAVGSVCRKIMEALASGVDGHDAPVTASIGVSYYPSDGNSLNRLLEKADAAMYHVKETGKNNFANYRLDIEAKKTRRMKLETSINTAIEQNRFFLVFQPEVDLRTNTIVALESFVRLVDVEGNTLPPDHFLRLAEDLGRMGEMDAWVVKEAAKKSVALREKGLRIPVYVNVMSAHLDEDFLDVVVDVVTSNELAPGSLGIEVTESVFSGDFARAMAIIDRLRNVGVLIALDNFGTGFSNFGYLSKIKVDKIKVDRVFSSNVKNGTAAAAIISSTVNMSRGLGTRVLVEGVETEEDRENIADLGCDEIQGFLVAKPMTFDEMTPFIDGWNHRAV